MTTSELFRVSSAALTRHKLRAFLTLLGVIIGVMTVVGVVSVISGLNDYVKDKVIGLNPDIVVFTKYGIITSREELLLARKRQDLTLTDMEVVRRECRSCASVGARGERNRPVKYEDRKLPAGRGPGLHGQHGRGHERRPRRRALLHRDRGQQAAPVAVIGWDVKDELFPNIDPIGRTMKIDGYPGQGHRTLAKQGSVLGQSQDNVIYVPLTLFHKHIAPTEDIGIFVKPKGGVEGVDGRRPTRCGRSCARCARRGYDADDPVRPGRRRSCSRRSGGTSRPGLPADDPHLRDLAGRRRDRDRQHHVRVGRGAHEGDRRAAGARRARRKDIRRQFLLEAALLSSVGGVIGVMLGALIALAVKQVFPAQVRLSFIVLGVGVATVTGLLAGWIPSSQASKLPPVEALRYE